MIRGSRIFSRTSSVLSQGSRFFGTTKNPQATAGDSSAKISTDQGSMKDYADENRGFRVLERWLDGKTYPEDIDWMHPRIEEDAFNLEFRGNAVLRPWLDKFD